MLKFKKKVRRQKVKADTETALLTLKTAPFACKRTLVIKFVSVFLCYAIGLRSCGSLDTVNWRVRVEYSRVHCGLRLTTESSPGAVGYIIKKFPALCEIRNRITVVTGPSPEPVEYASTP